MNDDRPHKVVFDDIYSAETQEIVDHGIKVFGALFAIKESTECDCKLVQLYPEVMTYNKDSNKFVCPFCYKREEYNNDWGYEVFNIINDDEKYYGYRLVVSFKNEADACFFYTILSDKFSKFISLRIQNQ